MANNKKGAQVRAKQRRTRFIKEYLLEHNATRAAIAAGYSKKTAGSQGHRLLKNVEVQQSIAAAEEKANAKADVTIERVRQELARIGFADVRKLFKDDGSVMAIADLDDDTAAAVGGVDVNELFEGSGEERAQVGYIKKLKMWDKVKALELLGKNLKMFTDKVEISAGDELIAKILAGRTRAAECRQQG